MPNYTGNLNLAKPIPMVDVADIQVINENMDKLDQWSSSVDEKTKAATSAIPGIVKYGTEDSTALEGHRMAQIQGVEKCGGDVQTPGIKKVGYSYWCTANKDFYVCKVENSLNYIDSAYFDAFSNYSLLGKLQNLVIYRVQRTTEPVAQYTITEGGYKILESNFTIENIQGYTPISATAEDVIRGFLESAVIVGEKCYVTSVIETRSSNPSSLSARICYIKT